MLRSCSGHPAVLGFAIYLHQFLDSLRHLLKRLENRHISSGEARAWLNDRHETCRLDRICSQATRGVESVLLESLFRIVKNAKLRLRIGIRLIYL